jgi:hypothetical protein
MILTLLLVAAGCAKQGPADDNLTNGWPMLAEAKYPLPSVGQCLELGSEIFRLPRAAEQITDCAKDHDAEVVLVGMFTGAAAAALTPPAVGTDGARDAYAQCDRAADDYVGGEWRIGLLSIDVDYPLPRNWDDGARFFICRIEQEASKLGPHRRTGSLKGALGAGSTIRRGCFNEIGTLGDDGFISQATDALPVDCATRHNAEFAGLFTPKDGPFPADDDPVFDDGCITVVAGYLNLSVRQLTNHRDLWYSIWVPGMNRWRNGERAAECYVSVREAAAVKTTLKGIGTKALPR